jgi:hypothetical protein
MDRITFYCKCERNDETCEVETSASNLSDVLETFERFLRGAGFVFEGNVTIVNDIYIKEPKE